MKIQVHGSTQDCYYSNKPQFVIYSQMKSVSKIKNVLLHYFTCNCNRQVPWILQYHTGNHRSTAVQSYAICTPTTSLLFHSPIISKSLSWKTGRTLAPFWGGQPQFYEFWACKVVSMTAQIDGQQTLFLGNSLPFTHPGIHYILKRWGQ